MGENNHVEIFGRIKCIEFSHRCRGENYYKGILESKRYNGVIDEITIFTRKTNVVVGTYYRISGKLYSRRKFIDPIGKRLFINVFATGFKVGDDTMNVNCNIVELCGSVYKPVVAWTMPNGIHIVNVFIAVKSDDGKSIEYVPCIVWEKNAKLAASLVVNEKISVVGRLHSRRYEKNGEVRNVCELSVNKIQKVLL